MAISSFFGAVAFKLLPHQTIIFTHNFPICKTLISSPTLPSSFFLSKSISFERLPTTTTKNRPQSLCSPSSPSSLQPIDELPPKLQEIIKLFQSVQQSKAKYEQLLFYGRNLPPLDARYKTRENKVEGCVSQVWVRAYLDPDRNVWFEADSDSILTKGLAALLVQGLSGRPAIEIIRVKPDFITVLGLQQSLTASRNNGFLNMLKLMQIKALILDEEDQNSDEEEELSVSGSEPVSVESGFGVDNENGSSSSGIATKNEIGSSSSRSSSNSNSGLENGNGEGAPGVVLGERAQRIKDKLGRELSPIELDVEDVSYQHAGHVGNRGGDDGTHINLKIVSKEFEGKSVVKRHRMIYALLQDELQSGLHALSIVGKAPGEVA